MKNNDDMNVGEGPSTPEERRSARLVAFLLGELDASETREVEAQLAEDPALRAEADELSATIGLVRGELGAEPSLPAAALGELQSQAATAVAPAPAPARGRLIQGIFGGFGSVAAAGMLVVGGTLALLQWQASEAPEAESMAFGYDLGGGPVDTTVGRASHPAGSPSGAPAPDPSSAPPQSRPLVTVPQGGKLIMRSKDAPKAPQEERLLALRQQPTVTYEAATVSVVQPQPQARNEAPQLHFVTPPEAGIAGGGGGYRGAGDSVPPATTVAGLPAQTPPALGVPGGGGAGGPSGPGTPGPGAPSSSFYALESPPPPTGRGRLRASGYAQDKGEALASLGYGVAPEESVEQAVTLHVDRLGRLRDDQGRLAGDFSRRDARRLADEWIQHCRPLPNETPRAMYFRFYGDNPFVFSREDALATFAADVDTASYALARKYLVDGRLPEKEQVRTEEFVNVFHPDVAPPTEDTFRIETELTPSPFGGSEARWLLRVGIRGKEVARDQRDPLALTFVVDTSGSMRQGQRLELVKHALRLLVSQLDARDSIALVAFNREARLILPMTPANQRGVIESALYPLEPNGGTNAEAGLKLGYELAATQLVPGVHNRVVFLSDGVANVGETDQDRLSQDVKHHRERGIYLNTIGVGMGNHSDVFLERLANQGDGICDYVDDAAAVERAIVERFTGAFVPIASDVKIQVEFDPSRVLRWRQLGYENRAIADADFRNDAVDAGEVGAGHQVTALFELERVSGAAEAVEQALATVRLRWKAPKAAGQDPNETEVFEREHQLQASQALGAFESGSYGFQRAALAAQFAELLRQSTHARGDSVPDLLTQLARLRTLPELAGDKDTEELQAMVQRAVGLGLGRWPDEDRLSQAIEEYRRHQLLQTQLRALKQDVQSARLEELRRTNDLLEQEIRKLCLQEVR